MSKPPTLTQSPEATLEQTTISRRKRARLDRLLGETMDSIAKGESRSGHSGARVRQSTPPRRGGAR